MTSSRSTLPRRALAVVLGLLAVAAAVLLIVEIVVLRPQHADAEMRQRDLSQVRALAEKTVVQLDTYDPASLEDYRTAVGELLSAKARAEFETQFEDFAEVVSSTSMTSESTVRTSGVAALDEDSATVLVVSDAEVTASDQNYQRFFRFQVDLVKVAGEWQVDKAPEQVAP